MSHSEGGVYLAHLHRDDSREVAHRLENLELRQKLGDKSFALPLAAGSEKAMIVAAPSRRSNGRRTYPNIEEVSSCTSISPRRKRGRCMDDFASGTQIVAVLRAGQGELDSLKTQKERRQWIELHVPVARPIRVGSMVGSSGV